MQPLACYFMSRGGEEELIFAVEIDDKLCRQLHSNRCNNERVDVEVSQCSSQCDNSTSQHNGRCVHCALCTVTALSARLSYVWLFFYFFDKMKNKKFQEVKVYFCAIVFKMECRAILKYLRCF